MTLVLADWVVQSAHAEPLQASGIRVVGARIVDIDSQSSLIDRYPDDDVVDTPGSVLMPGFVNAHVHLYGTLAHGIPLQSAPSGFWSFLEDFWWPKIEDRLDHPMIEAATDWVCAEMLRSGTTTFYDILEAPNALPDALSIEKRVAEARGIRGIVSFEACERIDAANGQMGIAENRALIAACEPGDLVQGAISIHTTFTCSAGFIDQAFGTATDLGVFFHAHVNEGVHEGEWCEANLGKRTFEYYEELGVAGPNFLASQCVQMSQHELDIVADSGVRVSHMPLSNCEVGGGIAPMTELLARGTTVGLGSDGYVNDMFEVMRGAFLVHKARLLDPGAMPASDVFHMATAGAADALGIDDIGSIAVGNLADVQLVDATFATPVQPHNLLDQLVLWRNQTHVSDVMVNGEWRVRDHEVLDADTDRLRATMHEQALRLWDGT